MMFIVEAIGPGIAEPIPYDINNPNHQKLLSSAARQAMRAIEGTEKVTELMKSVGIMVTQGQAFDSMARCVEQREVSLW